MDKTIQDLNLNSEQKKKSNFTLSKNVIDEILSLNENEILRYLVFRYKYEIFPLVKKLINTLHIYKLSLHQYVIIDVFFVLRLTKHSQTKKMVWEKWI